MPDVGDEILLASKKVGQDARRGTVTKVGGTMLTVRWTSGEESVFVPGPGSLTVVAHHQGKHGAHKRKK
jgi:hypothetical protein